MKKNMILLILLMLWASPATAQQTDEAASPAAPQEFFDAKLGLGYRYVSHDRNPLAAEYEYLKSSAAGALDIQWDPLPHRFMLESTFLNQKDYFGEMDYAYRDVVVLNVYARDVYHNLDHLSFGPDDPSTLSPSWVDKNPHDVYGIENQWRRAFIRFKTPDFPFHVYADARTVDRVGTMQQRFMRGFAGGLNRVSQSRDVSWHTEEATIGMNSHLGPLEAEISHMEKKFTVNRDKVLTDAYAMPAMNAPHNLVPDLKSSADTVKIHTSLTGKIVAAATYAQGEKKNVDSSAKSKFQNTAGDLTLIPITDLLLAVRYRHYDVSMENPDRVTVPELASTYKVRDPLSSKRDVMTGVVRYRVTQRFMVKGEYIFDSVTRDVTPGEVLSPLQIAPVQGGAGPNFWEVASRTTKGTAKLGFTYRIMNKLSLRADYSATQVTNPAYAMDPDHIASGKASLTWSPIQRVTAVLGYSGVREKRDEMSAPLAGGSRTTNRDQALGSLTVLVGKRSSVTAGYLYLKNKSSQSLTYRDAAGMLSLESGVPYADTAQVASLSATQALGDRVTFTAEASRSISAGRFRNYGSASNANATGFDELTDLKLVETIYTAGLETQFSKYMGSEVRYQQRILNDKIDNTQDGKMSSVLATLSVKW